MNFKNTINDLISHIKSLENPDLIANKISYFISDALDNKIINHYEAYLVNWEEINFRRISYTSLGWNGSARISTCLAILNQRLLAQIFNDLEGAAQLKLWGLEAFKLNNEKRKHYILDRYEEFLDAKDVSELLKELLNVRNNYQTLSFDNGPYHNEVFPFDFFIPEKILLENNLNFKKKAVDDNIATLIVELNLK